MAFVQSSTIGYQATTGGSGTSESTETIRLNISTSLDEIRDKKRGLPTAPRNDAKRSITPEIRAKIRGRWRAACEAADRLVRSASGDHAECLFFAGELKERLAELWALREYRDEDWVGILDRVQVAIGQIEDQSFESIELRRANVIRVLVKNLLSPATKSENDLREAVRLVSELDVPPFGDLAALALTE